MRRVYKPLKEGLRFFVSDTKQEVGQLLSIIVIGQFWPSLMVNWLFWLKVGQLLLINDLGQDWPSLLVKWPFSSN